MSAYKDFVIDFPSRCLDLLCHVEPNAALLGREVTFLLTIASSAFLPFERLNDAHPSKDALRFERMSARLNELLGAMCAKSALFPKRPTNWLHGVVDDVGFGPDAWPPTDTSVSEKPVVYVVRIIRNALAHGNLYTKGNPIQSLVFYSEKRVGHGKDSVVNGYKHLTIPVTEFRQFLHNWFRVLNSLGVPYRDVLRVVANAA